MRKLNVLVILLLSACSVNNNDNFVKDNDYKEDMTNIDEEIQEEPDVYVDDNKIKLSLFAYDGNYRNKNRIEETYYANFINGTDIGSFEVFLTSDSIINGRTFKDTWYTYYNEYENIENYKVGFNIEFVLYDGTSYSSNYFEPDTYKYAEYFYTYLYDDVNQVDGSYYGHLEEVSDKNILTSIKIYAVSGIDKVESFKLTAFTYDSEDDFDENGNYRGNSLYVINIKRK